MHYAETVGDRLNPDQRTQAVIYKNQGLRTDLFGFGAIVYDLLTCGKSPERFYNNLIADDVLRTSVTSIMDNYGQPIQAFNTAFDDRCRGSRLAIRA
jgi:hypothetical protein